MHYQSSYGRSRYILWSDEIGRHALLSRGWGSWDKRSIDLRAAMLSGRVDHSIFCAMANYSVEVRLLPLQLSVLRISCKSLLCSTTQTWLRLAIFFAFPFRFLFLFSQRRHDATLAVDYLQYILVQGLFIGVFLPESQ